MYVRRNLLSVMRLRRFGVKAEVRARRAGTAAGFLRPRLLARVRSRRSRRRISASESGRFLSPIGPVSVTRNSLYLAVRLGIAAPNLQEHVLPLPCASSLGLLACWQSRMLAVVL